MGVGCETGGLAQDLSHPLAQDAGMAAVHFTPWQAARPCWHCTRWAGMAYQGTVALCNLANGPRVRSDPATGCSHWERELGSDDEPGPPSFERRISRVALR